MYIFSNISYVNSGDDHCLSFIVQGEPAVQQRPKISYRNRSRPVYYDPSSQLKKKWKNQFKEYLSENMVVTPVFGSDPLVDKGIILLIEFFIKPPAVDYEKKKGIKMRKDTFHLYPSTKDLDNMIKFCMDAMQDVAYMNDNVICKLECFKSFINESSLYTEPFTLITLKKN